MIPPQSAAHTKNARSFRIEAAVLADVPALHRLVCALAAYERLAHLVVAAEKDLATALFGRFRCAEALIARVPADSHEAAGFALFFHTYSTFLGRRTLWLEDLFVRPECRGMGIGKRFLERLAGLAVDRDCGRFEWAVLDWNAPAIAFYRSLGADVMPDWRIARVTGASLSRLAAFREHDPPRSTSA